jgi:uncharacterized membrane protein YoaK (UPF0700 family)
MNKSKQMSDKYLTGALLAIVGGYLDAYTYICRGHVFANAQTGNIVLLGIRIADGEWSQSLYYLIPIVAFLFGILVAEMIKSRYRLNRSLHWRQIIIAIEVVVLAIVAFLPKGSCDMLANTLVSFVSSLQVESFRKVNGNSYVTTMCTGNLRSATEQMFQYRLTKNRAALQNSLQYYGIILYFIIGAVTGALLSNAFGEISVLFACIGLATVFLIMFKKDMSPDGN